MRGDVREVDWVVESEAYAKFKLGGRSTNSDDDERPGIIIASDCVYNPTLSAPLAHTISHLAGPNTVVLIAAELRDPDPLEEFLRAWLEEGWRVARVGFEEGEEIGSGGYVVWVGWRGQAP